MPPENDQGKTEKALIVRNFKQEGDSTGAGVQRQLVENTYYRSKISVFD